MKLLTSRHAVRPHSQTGYLLLLTTAAGWVSLAGLQLSHRLLVTNDSVSSYAHVRFISHRLFDSGSLPYSMPVLAHGEALAFPYAFIPWMAAALFRPVLGDWAVTLALVSGGLGFLAACFWAFPELRHPHLAALTLLNPALIESVVLGQLPFLWAAAFVMLSIGAWRRDRWLLAILLGAAGQATHAAIVMPLTGLLVLLWLPYEQRPRLLLASYVTSVIVALPAVYMVLASPVVGDAGGWSLVSNFFGTLAIRAFVITTPVGLALAGGRLGHRAFLALSVAMALVLVAMAPLRNDGFAWTSLFRKPDHSVLEFTRSPGFVRGATFRVLSAADGKVPMYDVLRAGARLDSELFPESIARKSWGNVDSYVEFLRSRDVQFVVIYYRYDGAFRTNEHLLLRQMASSAGGDAGLIRLTYSGTGFEVYDVRGLSTSGTPAEP